MPFVIERTCMNQRSIQAIVLAAGKSTRFNTDRIKLLEKLCGQEIILYVSQLLQRLKISTTFVVGHQAEQLTALIQRKHPTAMFSLQAEQRGTGHALAASRASWQAEHIMVINADMPLITDTILNELIETHFTHDATISLVTSHTENPTLSGYGRVIRENNKIRIIEARDFKGNPADECCINAGIYIFKRSFLQESIDSLSSSNASGEFYLTDLMQIASEKSKLVNVIQAAFDHVRGVNTLKELWSAEQIKRSELISDLMQKGVRFHAAQAVHVDVNVSIGRGSVISYGAHIINGTVIGTNCIIEPFSIIDNSTLSNNVTIFSHSVVRDSFVESNVQIGPFAHIRQQSSIKEESTIGNFVELKSTTLGVASKAKHLAYLGDSQIGKKVNIGAGTITCNHNGVTKHKTIIDDNAYIGSNSTLVAPIKIGDGAYTAAGSVITEHVPANALAIGRAYQVNKEGYAAKLRKRYEMEAEALKNSLSANEPLSFFGALKSRNDSLLSDNT